MELHIFSDALIKSHGAIAYLVIPASCDNLKGQSKVWFSKSKVSHKFKLKRTGLAVAANIAGTLLDTIVYITRKILWCNFRAVLFQCSTAVNKASHVNNKLCQHFEIRYLKSSVNPVNQFTKRIGYHDKTKWDIKNPYNLFPKGATLKHETPPAKVHPKFKEFNTFCGYMLTKKPIGDRTT